MRRHRKFGDHTHYSIPNVSIVRAPTLPNPSNHANIEDQKTPNDEYHPEVNSVSRKYTVELSTLRPCKQNL